MCRLASGGPSLRSGVTAIAVLGPLLLVSAQDGRVTVWDTECLEYIAQLRVSDGGAVTDLLSAPRSAAPIITTDDDGSLQFWGK